MRGTRAGQGDHDKDEAGGFVFGISAAEWPWWWLTHALGAYALHGWRPRAMLEARAVELGGKMRPLAGGRPGETALNVAE